MLVDGLIFDAYRNRDVTSGSFSIPNAVGLNEIVISNWLSRNRIGFTNIDNYYDSYDVTLK
ncbi:hypothetical protein QMA56_01890 [Leuconostoc falkenbergense]|uniref:hypothetical protein n=1 Tax=Leuconostoc falkenbergense TaxID=2766470 RepID=UPI0024AE42E0|nr:hypothetical protein [Leuconostoc falkenbergense]MDI6666454.1 hypothetical protein [Leuconostoc falkenbergense]